MYNLALKYLDTIDTAKWETGIAANKEEIIWQPLLQMEFDHAPKRIIGITDNGYWAAQWSNGTLEAINSRDTCLNLLVCLEKVRDEFFVLLEDAVRVHNLSSELIDTFPLVELLKFALQSETHWATSAVYWLRDHEIDQELEGVLNKFVDDKRFPQQARHYAYNVLKRWQKASKI